MSDDGARPLPDYKSSVFLPRTDFPMKGELPRREPERIAAWQRDGLYGKIREARRGAPKFILHDGPPYANSELHLGHALNHALKDFVVKSRTMLGYDAPFRPGWDCHGLPIEQRVEKAVGRGKLKAMSPREIRALCRAHAGKVIETQKAGILRLGVMGEFDAPQESVAGPGYYRTLGRYYEAEQVRLFGKIHGKGLAHRALKSVHWCGSCHTALAEAEIEYEQKVDPSIYVAFPVLAAGELPAENLFAIIWTTTPWTLPANRAIAVHPEEDYLVIQPVGEKRRFLVAEKLIEKVAASLNWPKGGTVVRAGLKYEQLKAWKYRHPLAPDSSIEHRPTSIDFLQPFVPAGHVDLETGTGLVHTAPGHGADDYLTGVKHGLEIACPVDAHGVMRKDHPTVPDEVVGKTIWDAGPLLIELLRGKNLLLRDDRIAHSYPCCWRCHNKLFFRATPQWFVSMDKPLLMGGKASLRELAIQAIDRIQLEGGWIPAWGFDRIRNMIAGRPDWCVSRQRLWGVPIAVFYCEDEKCGEVFGNEQSFAKIAGHFEQNGCDDWYEQPAAFFLPAGAACAKCGGTRFRKETDILDVWFDSGSSHRIALEKPSGESPWADLYVEGSDQHRGWFHTSLLIGVALDEQAPYRQVLTHGFTLDGEGRPMSKSLGNGVDPEEIHSKYGAEVLRLWVAASDYTSDIRFSRRMLEQHAESYRKFRNTFKYMLGVLSDFDPARHAVAGEGLRFLDRYLLLKAKALFADAAEDYRRYAFHALYRKLSEFVILDLSNFYLSLLKDALYVNPPDARRRRAAQTAVFLIAKGLIKALAPLIPFTSEEAYALLPAHAGKRDSVHLDLFDAPGERVAAFPAIATRADDALNRLAHDAETLARGEEFRFLRDRALKALESGRAAGRFGDGLEAVLFVEAEEPAEKRLLEWLGEERAPLLGVSAVELRPLSGCEPDYAGGGLAMWAVNAGSEAGGGRKKCARCWWRTGDIGADANYPGVCARCAGFLAEMGWRPQWP